MTLSIISACARVPDAGIVTDPAVPTVPPLETQKHSVPLEEITYDTFRLTEDGMITEHWDSSEVWVGGAPPGAEFWE